MIKRTSSRATEALFASVLLSVVFARSAAAQDPMMGIHVDQDVFFPPAEDKDYTMGVQADFLNNARGQNALGLFDFIFRSSLAHADLSVSGPRPEDQAYDVKSAHVGMSAFTVQKGENGSILALSDPIVDDRPYASLLYVRARRSTWRGSNAFVSELTVGALGLPIAETVQTFIHRYVSDDVDPGGWNNQISNGGEITAAYSVGYRRQLLGEPTVNYWTNGSPGDVMVTADASVGYYTSIRVGLQGRFGLVQSPWPTAGTAVSNLVIFVAPDLVNAPPQDPVAARKKRDRSCWCLLAPREIYAWLNAGWTVWGYNELLQGGFRDSSPVRLSYNADSPAPLRRGVLDVRFGITARWNRAGVAWTVITRHSPLFGGPKSRFHEWGSLYLTFFR